MKRNTDARNLPWPKSPMLGVMPLRLTALHASSGRRAARARHREFLIRSTSYRAAVNANAAVGDVATIGGLRWRVPPSDRSNDGFAKRLLVDGWLPVVEIEDSRQLAAGMVMLDIGANIGTTSIPRVVLGDFQRVYAAEPEPANYAALVENVVANGLAGYVMPDQLAIGGYDGGAAFEVHPGMATHHLLAQGRVSKGLTVTVPIRTLDSWVRSLELDLADVAFVKTDCQGWEGHILLNAPEVLSQKHIVWQIEFWPRGIQASGCQLDAVYELLASSFSHAIDLGGRAEPWKTDRLRKALGYLDPAARAFTELLLYNID